MRNSFTVVNTQHKSSIQTVALTQTLSAHSDMRMQPLNKMDQRIDRNSQAGYSRTHDEQRCGDIYLVFSTTHFSPQQRHLAEKIGTGSHLDKGNTCCRNVNNKIE